MGLQMPVGKLTLAWLLLLLGVGVAYADHERMLPSLPNIPINDPVARFQYMAALSYGRTQAAQVSAPTAPQPARQEDDSSRRPALPIFYVLSSKVFPDKLLKEAGLFAKRVPPYSQFRQPNPDFEYRPPCDCPHCHPPGGGQFPPGGGYPPNGGGYPPPGYPPGEGGYPPNGGYPQEGYPPNGYPPNGYPPNNGGYPDNNYQPGYPQGGGRPPGGGVRPNPPLGPDGYPLRPGYPDDSYPQKPQRPTRPSGDQQRPQNEPVHEKPNRPRPTKPSRPQDTLFKPVSSYPQAQYPANQYPQQTQYPQNSQYPQQHPYAPQYQPPGRTPLFPEFYPEKKPSKPSKYPAFYGPQYPYQPQAVFVPSGFPPGGYHAPPGTYPNQMLGIVPGMPYPQPPVKPPKHKPAPPVVAPIEVVEQKPAKLPEDQMKPTVTVEPEPQQEEEAQPEDEQKPDVVPEEEAVENPEDVESGNTQEEESSPVPLEEGQDDPKIEEEASSEPEGPVSTDEENNSQSEAAQEEPQPEVDEEIASPEDEKMTSVDDDGGSNLGSTKKIQISKNPDLYISPDDAAFLKHIGELKRFQDKLASEKENVAREEVEHDEIPRVEPEMPDLRSAIPYGADGDGYVSRYAPLYNPAQYGDDDSYWGGYYGGAY